MVAAANSENQMPQMASNMHTAAANCTENNASSTTANQQNSDDDDRNRDATLWCYLALGWDCVRTVTGLLYLLLETALKLLLPVKYQSKNVKGYNVLVTGAGSGIGRCLANKFSELGCTLILWDINKENNEETAAMIRAKGKTAHSYICDVSSKTDIYRVADRVKNEIGNVDILVNNAGIVTGKNLLDCTDQDIIKTMQVNVLAHFWTIKAFLPKMIERNSGHIVTISSTAGVIGVNKLTGYCASKFACVGLDEALRSELNSLKKNGVHLTLACPYYTNTGMFLGAKTRFPSILPVLETEFVADKIIDAVLCNQEVLYVPRIIYFIAAVKGVIPVKCWSLLLKFTGSSHLMDEFRGRSLEKPTKSMLVSSRLPTSTTSPSSPSSSILPILSSAKLNNNSSSISSSNSDEVNDIKKAVQLPDTVVGN